MGHFDELTLKSFSPKTAKEWHNLSYKLNQFGV